MLLAGQRFMGKTGYKRLLRLFAETFPGSREEVTKALATEDQVEASGMVRGTATGSRNLPTGALKAAGRSGERRFCSVWQIRQDKLARLHQSYGMLTQMEQLGLVPAWGQAME